MKKRQMVTTAVMLSCTMVLGMNVNAEITEDNYADFMGEWYANYIESEGMRINVGAIGMSMLVTINEDGTCQATVSYPAEEEGEEAESESLDMTWELSEGKLILTGSDDSVLYMEDADDELIGDTGEGDVFIFGREQIVEEVNWDELYGQTGDQEAIEQAAIAKENPFVYDPEKKNEADIINAYVENYTYLDNFEVVLDETNGTFTAEIPGDDVFEGSYLEGTYEITENQFLNAVLRWEDGYESTYLGEEYAAKWDSLTLKEDLSNLKEVMVEMLKTIDWEHEFTVDSLTLEEASEIEETDTEDADSEIEIVEGTLTVKAEDYEFSYDYKIIPGVDPRVTISYYDVEFESDLEYNNYELRQ